VNLRDDLKTIVASLPPVIDNINDAESLLLSEHPFVPPPVLDTFSPASDEEIKKIIMSTKTTQCSLDPIPTKLLKDCIDVLLPIMTRIVNLSLSSGVMPTSLKKPLVNPLLKKLHLLLEILKNFRPVSNLAYLSKLIERVVAVRIISHMDFNHLHEVLQSSYKKYHSCKTALIKVHNDILQALDGRKCVLLILLDLSAAFDTVDHQKLLTLLSERLGLQGIVLKWFENYLSDRVQSVLIDGVESDIWNILFGVPQGSVLGPILFIIYTSPLGDILHRHNIMYHLYADDTQMYLSFDVAETKEAFELMEKCISEIRVWMASNLLHLNDSKTEMLLIGSKNMLKKVPDLNLHIGTEIITPSRSARNIGAVFDDTMSMDGHISQICKGAWHHLRQIGQIRKYLDSSSSATLMHSFVSSRLDSFNSLLYGVPKQQLNRIQRIQNAAARVISRTKKFDHITPVLMNLHWLPIAERINFKIILLAFKALHGMAPKYIQDMVKIVKRDRTLRSNNLLLLQVPKSNTASYGDRCFAYAAPHLWNQLPLDCREAETVATFKVKLKTHLFKKAFNI